MTFTYDLLTTYEGRKLEEYTKLIFDHYIDQCRDPYDGSLMGQERVLDAMKAAISESIRGAYSKGHDDGWTKRDIEVWEER